MRSTFHEKKHIRALPSSFEAEGPAMDMIHEAMAITPFATVVFLTTRSDVGPEGMGGVGVSTTIMAICIAGRPLDGLFIRHDLSAPSLPTC
jgi:hypothetical protein